MKNIERYKLAEDADFRLKVNVASISAAGDILAGVDRSPYLINYAQIIISSPDGQGWLSALSHGVVSNVAITDESSDEDIQFTLNSIFTKYAKAYYKIVDLKQEYEIQNKVEDKSITELKKSV